MDTKLLNGFETDEQRPEDEREIYSEIGLGPRQKVEYDMNGVVTHYFKEDVPINVDPFLYDYSPRKAREKWL